MRLGRRLGPWRRGMMSIRACCAVWRRQVRDGNLAAVQARHFVPVRLTDPPLQAPATAPPVNNHLARDTIEIVLPYKAAACASAAALT
jgi:hypothetical protein